MSGEILNVVCFKLSLVYLLDTKKPQRLGFLACSINATADRLYVANKHIRDECTDDLFANLLNSPMHVISSSGKQLCHSLLDVITNIARECECQA